LGGLDFPSVVGDEHGIGLAGHLFFGSAGGREGV
jgi:hypothetical protein